MILSNTILRRDKKAEHFGKKKDLKSKVAQGRNIICYKYC